MLDDLAGKRTGERIQIIRERKGLTRPVLAGLVGMSPSWLKGIERGTRLPPRLPLLVKLAEALDVGDLALLAGTDMDIGGSASIPVQSFTRIPHDAVPAIREAVRDPLLIVPANPVDLTRCVNTYSIVTTNWADASSKHTSRTRRPSSSRTTAAPSAAVDLEWDVKSALKGRSATAR
jgi:transcriptional regulator with XRE-family HTH domain